MALDVQRTLKPIRKVRKLIKKMDRTPSPRQIHQFRTNARRVEAVLKTLSLDSRANGRLATKLLSRLRKRAGKIRDMDVMTDYASSVQHPDNESECSIQLLEHLGAERYKHARKFLRAEKQSGPKLRKLLKWSGKKCERVLSARGDENGSGRAEEVTASALKLIADLATRSRLNRANLHEYRLQVKELQNLLRMADSADQQVFVDRLGEVKDAIGEWHDWEELVGIAKKALDHGARCQLFHELQKKRDQKYKHALGRAEQLRDKELRSLHRGSKANSRQPGRPRLVWSAAASLAA